MIERILSTVFIAVLSIWAHELGHAFASKAAGERLGARRATFRPWVNLDPIFSVIVPLASSLVTGGSFAIGMGRPFLLSCPNWKVLLAGPTVNLTIFVVAALLGWWHVASVNLGLAMFNLIPIKPLDGWGVACNLRDEWRERRARKLFEARDGL